MKQLIIAWLVIVGSLFSCASPEGVKEGPVNEFNPLVSIVRFYQGPLNHLSAVKQSGCPMYPECSHYSIESFKKHGSFVGWMMTCDRLMRCGRDEVKLAPPIIVDGKLKNYDSVNNNDFWWHEE